MTSNPAKLIIDGSETCADLLYATKFAVGDPMIFLLEGKHSTILLSDLEIDRGKREAKVDEILSLSEFNQQHEGALGKKPTLGDTAVAFLKSRKVRHAIVPPSFPFALANKLAAAGIKLEPADGHLFPARQQKTAEELKLMRRALQITEAGMARGIEILSSSDIGKGRRLIWGGKPLTAERMRAEIDSAILHHGGLPMNTIVAGGDQGCDPHERVTCGGLRRRDRSHGELVRPVEHDGRHLARHAHAFVHVEMNSSGALCKRVATGQCRSVSSRSRSTLSTGSGVPTMARTSTRRKCAGTGAVPFRPRRSMTASAWISKESICIRILSAVRFIVTDSHAHSPASTYSRGVGP